MFCSAIQMYFTTLYLYICCKFSQAFQHLLLLFNFGRKPRQIYPEYYSVLRTCPIFESHWNSGKMWPSVCAFTESLDCEMLALRSCLPLFILFVLVSTPYVLCECGWSFWLVKILDFVFETYLVVLSRHQTLGKIEQYYKHRNMCNVLYV